MSGVPAPLVREPVGQGRTPRRVGELDLGGVDGGATPGWRLSRVARIVRGRGGDPPWVRPLLVVLLGSTSVLYLWGLGGRGWGYGIYSGAVQAGTKSLKAAFFGSLDAGNFITVDKPPAALWVMEVAAKVFGLSAWTVMVPQALEGLGTVLMVYLAVRRWSGPAAGLVAGWVTALTPVSAAVFRFDDPDALMVLLVTCAAYATVRAVDDGGARWSVVAGSMVGLGFLAKMLEALLVVPGLAAAYLLAGPGSLGRRVRHVCYGGGALVATAGWWVTAVQLAPASARPYIGSTRDNSVLSLIFGYNGFSRLSGGNALHVPGTVAGPGLLASTLRLFGAQMGAQASWLLPAALVLAGGALVLGRTAGRSDLTRSAVVLWGGWLLVMGLVFSYGKGQINPYYTVALAPAIGALVGVGGVALWSRRDAGSARYVLAGCVALSGVWAFNLLDRDATWAPWLREGVLAGGLLVGGAVLAWPRSGRRVRELVAILCTFVTMAGPVAYSVGAAVNPPAGADPEASAPTGGKARPEGGPGGGKAFISRPSRELVERLLSGAGSYTWVVATVGADPAAGYELATGRPAMAVGGWSGTDPVPTLTRFQQLVGAGKVHYFIPASPDGSLAEGRSYHGTDANRITRWVERHFRVSRIGGVELYDLGVHRQTG